MTRRKYPDARTKEGKAINAAVKVPWNQVFEIMDLLVLSRATFTSSCGRMERCKLNGKSYYRKHLLIARTILKDVKATWVANEKDKFAVFRDYYLSRRL